MPIEEENIKGLLSKWGLAAKPCDSCNTSPALLFCRADSAFLCLSCDAKIHVGDSRHARVWMCEVCEQAPAAVTCKADAAALCSSCDRDIHSANPLARRHDRVPVVPFFQTPSDLSASSASKSDFFVSGDVVQPPTSDAVAEESWLIPNLQGKLAGADFVYSSDVDSLLDSGSLNFSIKHQVNDQLCNHRSFADSVVPTHTKSSQLNNFSNQSCFEIDFTQSKLSPYNNLSVQCISQSISSSDVGIVPDGNSNSMSEVSNFAFPKPVTTKGGGIDGVSAAPAVQLSRFDREARVMRYREKRKNRKFEKTIRYASRKAYAEARPRIKGRFAKRTTDADTELSQMYASAAGCVAGGFMADDDLYGVVPSF